MLRCLAAVLLLATAIPAPAAPPDPAARTALQQALDDVLSRSALSQARVGLQVVRLDDGAVLYARNPDELLNPASNVKLFTTAAALVRLGPEFRFDTEFLVDRQPDQKRVNPPRFKSGDIKGPLYVRGKGDPTITAERLATLVDELWFAGLRSVSGDLVLDDTFFDDERFAPGFDQERSDKTYMAPVGALSLEGNNVGVHVFPGEAPGAPAVVELEPESPFFVVENRAVTGPEHGLRRLFVTSLAQGEKQKVVVTGRIPLAAPPAAVWRKIDHPTFYFGHTLKTLLERRGVKVKGRVRRAPVPPEALPYLVHQSDTLELVLKRANKSSSNFVAETLLKTLAAQVGAPGSWRAGVRVVEEFLAREVGLPLGTYVMKNGSGLNDVNRFSAAQTNRLLRAMWQRFPLAPEFLSSLAIAGKDGTIHYRMEGSDAVGRLRAKTGTLENVSALSGYVEAVGGERLVFSVLVNDFSGRLAPVVGGVDAVGVALAAYGQPGPPGAALAQVLGPQRQPGPLDELKARARTYDAVARTRDVRNRAFLRTALRTERDPALRMVIADALVRLDPEDGASARLFLENLDTGPDGLGRLRALAQEPPAPTPTLASLLRLAAEGSADALTKLLEVVAQAKRDEALRAELLAPLGEVARNAPDELVAVLQAAREQTLPATLDVLAAALVLETGEHPLPAALSRAERSADPVRAAFARSLADALQHRMAAERARSAAPGPVPSVAAP